MIKNFSLVNIILAVVVMIVFTFFYNEGEEIKAFAFGLGLFEVNLFLIVVLSIALFHRALNASSSQGFKISVLMLLSLIKIGIIAAGLYVGLVLYNLAPFFLLAGALVGLVLSATTGTILHFRYKK